MAAHGDHPEFVMVKQVDIQTLAEIMNQKGFGESVQQRNYWLVTKRVFFDRFCDQLNDSFVALTQCDKQISTKWQKIPKKKTQSKF